MKAINCTQCGATIEDVSERSMIIRCSYCGARILIDPIAKPLAAFEEVPEVFDEEPATTPTLRIVAVVVVAAVVVPMLIGALFLGRTKTPEPRTVHSAPANPVPYATPFSWNPATESVKPAPVVNYQPRVSWDGPNDTEYFAEPEVDVSSVADLSTEDVKKTVFKNRVVKLRVVINTEGEIDSVESLSGHPLLVEAATESAKKSIFHARSKPATRILTYTFRVLKD
ncbi:MAG: hypothetical protein ABIO91_00910 [Pyrinomonadaceae bacterium]